MNIQERVKSLLETAINQCDLYPELALLKKTLSEVYERLYQPMRVAIVGKIKAGKSTVVNALLGEEMVATGAKEMTYNVCWLRYGDSPRLIVHYKDGRTSTVASLTDLEVLSTRPSESDTNTEHSLTIRNIKHIDIFYPNEALKILNLVDTPGLKSFFSVDEQNTLAFFGVQTETLSTLTEQEVSQADAIVYMFGSKGPGEDDYEILELIQGGDNGELLFNTPINSIGVLTKSDIYWSEARQDPLIAGAGIIAGLRAKHPQLGNIFYHMRPICGLLGFGAQTLTLEEFNSLVKLANIPIERLEKLLRNAERFTTIEYGDIEVSPSARHTLYLRMGTYGVWLACQLIRDGLDEKTTLQQMLWKQSGMEEFRDLLYRHFSNHAYLIKLVTGFRRISSTCAMIRGNVSGTVAQIVSDIDRNFENIRDTEHAFRELDVLQMHIQGLLNFSTTEIHQIYEVTGAYGLSCASRLGMDDRSTIDEMLECVRQRIDEWQIRSDNLVIDPYGQRAAQILILSFERVHEHLEKAKSYLFIPV